MKDRGEKIMNDSVETTLKELAEDAKQFDIREYNEKRRKERAAAEMNEKKSEKINICKHFLMKYTPRKIENELNEYVVGQPELTKAVADFVYYHAMRQLHPELPVRNLLIAGSSGSGKTEVFRCVKQLYGDLINIKIVDGTRITKEGWSGSMKLDSVLSPELDVLVVDEADKLCTPSYSTGGNNVAKEMQGEFLKLMEGEYEVIDKRKPAYVIEGLSVVFVGAFESIRETKCMEKSKKTIGFGIVAEEERKADNEINDEDLIKFGVVPELLGRIAIKVVTNDLTNEDYLQILKNPHGRVSTLLEVLTLYGVEAEQVLSDEEILELIDKSKNNRTGFRWVSAQVENRILEVIREGGITIKEEKREISDYEEDDDEKLWTPDDDFFFSE